jgi:serine/threonine protein kinase
MDTGQQGQRDGALTGQVLGERYQLLSVLGSGGMGTVYKATHLGLGRNVAIKLLHPHIVGDEKSVQRFNQEMQVMSALNHPHLISIIDAGITKERAPYFVMEYLEGHPLSDELDHNGNLSEANSFKVALQIADALDYAHSKGIVHRDLKPNNIMLVGRNDFVKVVDLGIAKLASMGTTSDSLQKLTQTGEIFGSPLYMSPEQCLGKNVDYRADIYGLGCLIYEMVSNNLPITGETPIETLMHHISDPPKPLSQVPGLRMTPGLCGLEQIVMRCLEKDPAQRFQSMGELHQALEQVQQGATTGGYVAPAMNEQRDTRLSQGQIVPPVYGGGTGSEQSWRPSEPADADYNYRQAPTVDLSNRPPSGTTGDTGGYRATDGGRTTGDITTPPQSSGGRSPAVSFEKYIPMVIICATAVIGIIGIASVVMVFQQRNAPVVTTSNAADMSKNYMQFARDIANRQQRGMSELPVNQGSEGVELSSGDTPVQVLMVSEYSGIRSDEFKDNPDEFGETTVVVKYDRKPIILFLSGYLPINWVVKRESSRVNIRKICVNGYHAMRVAAPEGIPIEKAWYTYRNENDEKTDRAVHVNPFPYFTFAHFQDVKDKSGWSEVAATVKRATGQEVYKFWGKYFGDKFVLE